jgi:hypothetical protein
MHKNSEVIILHEFGASFDLNKHCFGAPGGGKNTF